MLIETFALLLSIVASIIAGVSLKKALDTPKMVEEQAENILSTLDETLKETLEPIQTAVKKSYSHMGSAGAMVKKEQALDRRLAQDMINQGDPMLQALLDMFPNAKEYVEKNPELIMSLIPRLQALSQVEGFNIADLLQKNPSLPSRTHPSHPFGMKEE